MAVFYAILCLIFSACNDFVFKAYARKQRSTGYFVSVIGIVWCITSCFFLKTIHVNWPATLCWGLISGFFSITANLLMLEAMHTLDAGVCSTIYRLNLVPALIGAAVLLGERLTLTGTIGILCAILAVIGFIPRSDSQNNKRKLVSTGFIMMILASLLRAAMGLAYRYGFTHGSDKDWVVLIDSIFWIIGGIFYYFLCEKKRMPAPLPEETRDNRRKLWRYGIGSGALVAGITLTMAASLAYGQASVVLPIAQMSFILTGILGVVFLKEKISVRKVIAMILGAAAILLLTIG